MLQNLGLGAQLTFFVLIGTLIFAIPMSLFFLFRPGQRKISNRFFGFLLLSMSATVGHHLFILLDIYKTQPKYLFLPIYYTLWFGPLIFLAVKTRLYPSYRLKTSDLKHAILPFGQLIYFLVIFQMDIAFRESLGRNFYSPFYGGMEMLLYVGTFYAYLYSAFRYIRHKTTRISKKQNQIAKRETIFLRRMVKMLVLLFWVNSAYIGTDFLVYEVFGFDLHTQFGFTRFGDISFSMMVYWVSWCCWRMFIKNV